MRRKALIRAAVFCTAALALSGCSLFSTTGAPKQDYKFSYTDVTKQAGIDFVHQKPLFDHKVDNIMPWLTSTGAGVFAGDYDGDGNMDLYFVNSKKGSKNALYHNNGNGTFTEVGNKLGLDDINKDGISDTALWFDYNNSGHESLFVGGWGMDKMFRNNGDGTFTDITAKAGLTVKGYITKAIALDYNKDGNLDLYIGTYFDEKNDLWNLSTTKIMQNDFERARNGGRNYLFRNNGDGTFTDVTKQMGVDDTGWTLATGTADVNNDGWPDIYNADDFGPDRLFLNQKGKGFKAYEEHNGIGDDTYKSMNVDFADLFHNGKFSMYVSNISKEKYILEGNQLWVPQSDGTYKDMAGQLGVKNAGFAWGAKFFDADNSGNMSLMVTNGFVSASKSKDYWFDLGTLATTPGSVIADAKNWPTFGNKSLSGYEQKFLFLNDGKTFKNVAQDVGISFTEDGRGIAVVDLWNRGTLDLVFANQGGPARLYKSTNQTGNHWITLQLTGSKPSNRDAIGARVTFEVNGVRTDMERDGGNSHGGQSDPRLHLGLGKSTHVDKITIKWPSGRVQTLQNVPGDQILKITEPTN